MADPTPLTHTTVYSRWTLQELRDYALFVAGGVWADLNTTEQGILDKLINNAHSQRHRLVRNARRWAEDSTTITWTGGDDKVALPANMSEILGRHIWSVDANGNPLQQIEFVRQEEFLDGFFDQTEDAIDPVSIWDSRDVPVAVLYSVEASTEKRILQIYPRPADGTKFRILYLSEANLLSNPTDRLEAPTPYNFLVAVDAAIEWLMARGDTAKASALVANRMRHESELVGARETDRPGRVRFYDEAGYPGSRQGEPLKGLLPAR